MLFLSFNLLCYRNTSRFVVFGKGLFLKEVGSASGAYATTEGIYDAKFSFGSHTTTECIY